MTPKTFVVCAACGLLALLLLYVIEDKPARVPAAVNTVSTNVIRNLYVHAALSNALLSVRADLAKATNAAEIAKLRAAEQAITNGLK